MIIESGKQNKEVFLSLDQIEDRTRRGIRQGFFRLGALLQKELRSEVMKKNKTGRLYTAGRTKKGRQRRHRSSAPGETPANWTGNYRRNIGYQIHGDKSMEFGIRDGADYALRLEEGTKRMEARPGVGNAVKATEKDAQRFFDSSLESEFL